jgi:hypothetical protein
MDTPHRPEDDESRIPSCEGYPRFSDCTTDGEGPPHPDIESLKDISLCMYKKPFTEREKRKAEREQRSSETGFPTTPSRKEISSLTRR